MVIDDNNYIWVCQYSHWTYCALSINRIKVNAVESIYSSTNTNSILVWLWSYKQRAKETWLWDGRCAQARTLASRSDLTLTIMVAITLTQLPSDLLVDIFLHSTTFTRLSLRQVSFLLLQVVGSLMVTRHLKYFTKYLNNEISGYAPWRIWYTMPTYTHPHFHWISWMRINSSLLRLHTFAFVAM
jgi:hypothetical protein